MIDRSVHSSDWGAAQTRDESKKGQERREKERERET
eukprot:COSAG02_NODE_13389_length_1400_cov_2.300538_2_plen_35_part_01